MIPRSYGSHAAALVIGLMYALVASSAPAASQIAANVDAAFAPFDKPSSPGAAVAIYRHGKLEYSQGYGLANIEYDIPIRPRTPFEVGSVSKQFTAFAIALLARDGKLSLDDDVRRYLPYMPDFGRRITIRHLLLHTSGLRDAMSLFHVAGHEVGSLLRQGQVVSMIARQRQLNFPPGTEYMYCNTGYLLLAEIVRAVSGQTLRDFTSERIFRPLGMTQSFFFDDVREAVPGRAYPYERWHGMGAGEAARWGRTPLNWEIVGGMGLTTTVEDLARWAGNFGRPVVGDPELIRQIVRTGALDDGTPIPYGFGLREMQLDGHRVFMHSGAAVSGSLKAIFVYYPDHDFAVAIAANGAREVSLDVLVRRVANLYLPRNPKQSSSAESVAQDRTHRDVVAGMYTNPFMPAFDIELRGERIIYREISDGSETDLVLRADATMDFGSPGGSHYRLVFDPDGRVAALDLVPANGVPVTRFSRTTRVEPSAGALTQLVGDYRSDELDVTYRVSIELNRLALRSTWNVGPITLTPVLPDRFEGRADRINWDVVVFERDACGRPTGLRLHTHRARGLFFEKVSVLDACKAVD